MKIGDKIATPHGEGTIVDIEKYSRLKVGKRYGVILQNNPFSYSPVYFFSNEVKSREPLAEGAEKGGGKCAN